MGGGVEGRVYSAHIMDSQCRGGRRGASPPSLADVLTPAYRRAVLPMVCQATSASLGRLPRHVRLKRRLLLGAELRRNRLRHLARHDAHHLLQLARHHASHLRLRQLRALPQHPHVHLHQLLQVLVALTQHARVLRRHHRRQLLVHRRRLLRVLLDGQRVHPQLRHLARLAAKLLTVRRDQLAQCRHRVVKPVLVLAGARVRRLDHRQHRLQNLRQDGRQLRGEVDCHHPEAIHGALVQVGRARLHHGLAEQRQHLLHVLGGRARRVLQHVVHQAQRDAALLQTGLALVQHRVEAGQHGLHQRHDGVLVVPQHRAERVGHLLDELLLQLVFLLQGLRLLVVKVLALLALHALRAALHALRHHDLHRLECLLLLLISQHLWHQVHDVAYRLHHRVDHRRFTLLLQCRHEVRPQVGEHLLAELHRRARHLLLCGHLGRAEQRLEGVDGRHAHVLPAEKLEQRHHHLGHVLHVPEESLL
mmetsp:Transcript_30008/g.77564  ORF Transcript_30008/g.77564 Transcript_30008/m.77564 type:complete len:476 (-) Transcript_30008:486-1913(-)